MNTWYHTQVVRGTLSALHECIHLPDELAEGLVVGQGAVVFLSEDVVDVLHAPVIEQVGRRLRLLRETNNKSFISIKVTSDLAITKTE